jgi:hypothetical protein
MREPTEQEIRNYSFEDYRLPPDYRSLRWLGYYVLAIAVFCLMLALLKT